LDLGHDLGRVIALVCDDGLGLATFQQQDRLGILGGLPGRDAEGDRQPGFVRQQVDLGAQTSSRERTIALSSEPLFCAPQQLAGGRGR
jgi:hypothetical protein